MVRIEYGRFGYHQSGNGATQHRKIVKPRQEICAILKWICFIVNCLIFIAGVTLLALGVYLWIKDPRSVSGVEDVLLNPSIVLACAGFYVCMASLCGLFGSLRDNSFLLKMSVWSSVAGYMAVVTCTFGIFVLFYADSTDGFSLNSIMAYTIKKYHLNHNVADVVDYVQETMECCGIRSAAQGYRDWQLSEQFYCNETNPFPERCGVPFSCCRKSIQSEAGAASGSLVPAMRSLQCWQNAQKKRAQDLETDLYVRGCLNPMKQFFESHAILIGSSVALALIPGCLYIFLELVLARQIEYQHYLLDREARRNQRRQRKEKARKDKLDARVNAMEQGQSNGNVIYAEPQPNPNPRKDSKDNKASTSQSPKQVAPDKKKKRRGRSTAPPVPHHIHSSNPNDPTGRVRQWVLQQSDFIKKDKPSE